MFIIPLDLLKNFRLFHYSCSKIFVIPLFLLKNVHHSIIPPKKAHIIPLFQEQNFRYSYSIIPLQPPIQSVFTTITIQVVAWSEIYIPVHIKRELWSQRGVIDI